MRCDECGSDHTVRMRPTSRDAYFRCLDCGAIGGDNRV
jgi:uncharacterized Zn finger protein